MKDFKPKTEKDLTGITVIVGRLRVITREDCLDYSGTHVDDCSGCETGKATKDVLLGER